MLSERPGGSKGPGAPIPLPGTPCWEIILRMKQTIDRTARRTRTFTESVIREMTRVARVHDAVNLAQGMPDFPTPELLKEAAVEAIRRDVNQYAITWGAPSLRNALAGKYARLYGMEVDSEREITVTCGATEAMASVMLALIDPGDEVIVLEPFYENYGPDAVLSEAKEPCLVEQFSSSC